MWGCFVRLSALRLDDGGFLSVASSGAPQAEAIDAYAGRWQVEPLFGCLKTRGFKLEDTHLTDLLEPVWKFGSQAKCSSMRRVMAM